ncbi:MAG TPA: biotin--[acetyl-CoA-carboxylase] ligase [Stellaceae bacterium]|jgi:BirA family biotin operon repressor/biotin-[acetyl-CoA-carboxylase] ligase|nr:biotin--[acetyl-CoA-carboxylase] ligase [Stellaceae bacterium]
MTGEQPVLPGFYRLTRYETVGSTNDEAKRLAEGGAPEGTLVWGLAQSAGRGRRGRPWQSPPGNLYVSLLLRPAGSPAQVAQLGFVAALGLGDALQPLLDGGHAVQFKWPNDVLLNGRKLAGILLESETAIGQGTAFVVIGIGVNLATAPADTEFPAVSLAAAGIPNVPPGLLLEAFAPHFESWYRRWLAEGFAPVRLAWLARASGLGEPVRVRLERATLLGRFLDLDEEGALLLEGQDGRRRVAAGEIFPAA